MGFSSPGGKPRFLLQYLIDLANTNHWLRNITFTVPVQVKKCVTTGEKR